ncbi:hypothetical protein ABLN97_05690 [Mycobacterium tuberculosis]
MHPDDFLLDQFGCTRQRNGDPQEWSTPIDPPFTPHSLLDALGEQVPQFYY